MDLMVEDDQPSHRRVMIVDDSELERKFYAEALSSEFTITLASSADKAWELLNRTPLPDAIILDVMMPEDDGLVFCQRIKENGYFEDIPIIFLSAATGPSIRSKAAAVGGADFVIKPPQMAKLVARINRHITHYRKTKRLGIMTYIDPLTHLPNAAKFNEVLKQEWARCARYWHQLSLLLIRVENLQAIKGHFGNDEYYAVVASIADDLCSVGASPGDLFAAYGEDTFALLLSDCGAEAARLKATQIKQKFAHPHFMAKHEASTRDIYCTVAFTVASPGGGSSTLELIETTEQLMLNSRFIEHDGIVTNAKLLGMEGTSTNPSER